MPQEICIDIGHLQILSMFPLCCKPVRNHMQASSLGACPETPEKALKKSWRRFNRALQRACSAWLAQAKN
jgi:hypothetical protein